MSFLRSWHDMHACAACCASCRFVADNPGIWVSAGGFLSPAVLHATQLAVMYSASSSTTAYVLLICISNKHMLSQKHSC
jgi:hypothetical protein